MEELAPAPLPLEQDGLAVLLLIWSCSEPRTSVAPPEGLLARANQTTAAAAAARPSDCPEKRARKR